MSRMEIPIDVYDNNAPPKPNHINDCLFLTGELKTDIATDIVKDMMQIELRNRSMGEFPKLTLLINCPGGDLCAAWMICDWMDQMETPIQTFALGQAASGGLIIFMNGTKGMRKATPNTQFMSHRYLIGIEASHADLMAQRVELDRTHDRIVNHYMKCTGLEKKTIEQQLLTEHNVWLDAKQCKKYNICDIITNDFSKKKKEKVK